MNTTNDINLIRLVEDTAAGKIAAENSQWIARGDGVEPDGSDNAQVTSEASNIYLPIDDLRADIKELYDPYETDNGDFIFEPYSEDGTSKELRISNVKWSNDGVELYKVCGNALSDYGESDDGFQWYKVDGYTECSTTQDITAYLLEDDTVKITTGSVSKYKDKVLIATAKNGIINRIVKSVIMRTAADEQTEIIRDWTVRNNGDRWEIFNPVWNLSDKQAVYPPSMEALSWNAVTDTSGKLYANLVSENKVADDGTVTTERSVILSSTESDIGQACVSSTSVSSVLIGEFKTDCSGNITGFCQYSDGAIAQADPKTSTINVFTSFKTATVETAGPSSSSPSTETHLQGFTTPIEVVAGEECTDLPAFDMKLSDIIGNKSFGYGPVTAIKEEESIKLVQDFGEFDSSGKFIKTGSQNLILVAKKIDAITSASICVCTNELVLNTITAYALEKSEPSISCVCLQKGIVDFAAKENSDGSVAIEGLYGWKYGDSIKTDGSASTIATAVKKDVAIGGECGSSCSVNLMTSALVVLSVGSDSYDGTETVFIYDESAGIAKNGKYVPPDADSTDNYIGSAVLTIDNKGRAVFARNASNQDTDQVFFYTAVSDSQATDTYDGSGNL